MSISKFIEKVCIQTAVYWGAPTPDGYGGKTYSDPVEISCLWDDTLEVIKDERGEEIICKARVLVTQDLEEGGMLYLGTLEDLGIVVGGNVVMGGLGTGNIVLAGLSKMSHPEDVEDAYEITIVKKIPMIRSTSEYVRTVYLNASDRT